MENKIIWGLYMRLRDNCSNIYLGKTVPLMIYTNIPSICPEVFLVRSNQMILNFLLRKVGPLKDVNIPSEVFKCSLELFQNIH